ncbi:MAG: acyl-CoA dehydrogenase N-terminal domain-containing protein, partial [Pseudomonadota bacterium]
MPNYTPPLRDLRFVLHETLAIQDQSEINGYADLTADATDAILSEAGRL